MAECMAEVEIPHNVVNGIVFPTFITQERLDELRDFHLKPDDLFIPPYPKSGTTWLQQIVKLIVRLSLVQIIHAWSICMNIA